MNLSIGHGSYSWYFGVLNLKEIAFGVEFHPNMVACAYLVATDL